MAVVRVTRTPQTKSLRRRTKENLRRAPPPPQQLRGTRQNVEVRLPREMLDSPAHQRDHRRPRRSHQPPPARPEGERSLLRPSKVLGPNALKKCATPPHATGGRGSWTRRVTSRDHSYCGYPYLVNEPLSTSRSDLLSRHCRWAYHGGSLPPLLNAGQRAWINQGFPDWSVRLGYGETSVHRSQKRQTIRLHPRHWPRVNGLSLWPSSPNFSEKLESMKKGWVDYPDLSCKHVTRVTAREFNENTELLKNIIRRQVVGVRSDIEVPKRYLSHFRYSRNFLFLSSEYPPIGLARFLASQWTRDPCSLWLEVRVSLKSYLRKVPIAVVHRSRKRFESLEDCCSLLSDGESDELRSSFSGDSDEI